MKLYCQDTKFARDNHIVHGDAGHRLPPRKVRNISKENFPPASCHQQHILPVLDTRTTSLDVSTKLTRRPALSAPRCAWPPFWIPNLTTCPTKGPKSFMRLHGSSLRSTFITCASKLVSTTALGRSPLTIETQGKRLRLCMLRHLADTEDDTPELLLLMQKCSVWSELSIMTPCSRHLSMDRAQLMAAATHLGAGISHVLFRTACKSSRLRIVKRPVHEGGASRHIVRATLRVKYNLKAFNGLLCADALQLVQPAARQTRLHRHVCHAMASQASGYRPSLRGFEPHSVAFCVSDDSQKTCVRNRLFGDICSDSAQVSLERGSVSLVLLAGGIGKRMGVWNLCTKIFGQERSAPRALSLHFDAGVLP